MNEMELEILTQCFSHRELARIYLVSLKERDRMRDELNAAIAGQETLQKACKVKHGKWIHTNEAFHWEAKDECSECRWHTKKRVDLSHFNYCPNCGARMDGE